MNFHILTLFPEMVTDGLNTSILGRAMAQGLIHAEAVNIRDYTNNRHGKVDDYIYGGGAGLLMQAQPVYDAWKAVEERIQNRRAKTLSGELAGDPQEEAAAAERKPGKRTRVVYLTPVGRTFNQSMAEEFSKEEDLILLCGHYEGIDERVIEEIVTDPVSIGDFVLTGGELPAMMIVDAVSRLVPGVLRCAGAGRGDGFLSGRASGVPAVFEAGGVERKEGSGHSALRRSREGRRLAAGAVPSPDEEDPAGSVRCLESGASGSAAETKKKVTVRNS